MSLLPLMALLASLATAPLPIAGAQILFWTRQAGTGTSEWGQGIAVDGLGNAYICGTTYGSLGGPNAGNADIFLAKYDTSGALLWTRQAGTTATEFCYGVTVDGAGNSYITGWTEGNLGGPSAGETDAFLAKYDAAGILLWTRQIGTPQRDAAFSVAVDGWGNAYITGQTNGSLGGPNAGDYDVFLAKYDASGALLWKRQAGTFTTEYSNGVAVDGSGNAYITGYTLGNLGGPSAGSWDVFLSKYDASGTMLWMRQTGTPAYEYAVGVAVDGSGNAYITGQTNDSLGGPNAGGYDVFLAKYNASGTPLWTRQAGTSTNEGGVGVAVDSAGNAYISGYSGGSLGGLNAGYDDYYLAKYNTAGALIWTHQAGTVANDGAAGVAVDGTGNVYLTGYTEGSLGGASAGGPDTFLAKYGPPPCYANCDNSTTLPVLNVVDFTCFLQNFAAQDPYANCDSSTQQPVLNVADFTCFLQKYAAGCP